MQFVTNGPDIPDALLQAHEEGRVVFFCGAGISRPAGLPDFGGLVQRLFQQAGEPADRVDLPPSDVHFFGLKKVTCGS